MISYYEILQVPIDATPDQIKSAYRSLSKLVHPDKSPDNLSAHSTFILVQKAYDTLIDPSKRSHYDATELNKEPACSPVAEIEMWKYLVSEYKSIVFSLQDLLKEQLRK